MFKFVQVIDNKVTDAGTLLALSYELNSKITAILALIKSQLKHENITAYRIYSRVTYTLVRR